MAATSRLDVLLVELGLLQTRQMAQAAIMDGGVLVDGKKITKAGTAVKLDANVELVGKWRDTRFVSRGGYKLLRALECFSDVGVESRVCIDLGASTGGFTDCLLQHGAAKVYAVDVGQSQLDWKLQTDPRVIVRDRTNARTATVTEVYDGQEIATLMVADLSFISLAKVLPNAVMLLAPEQSDVIALVKPQFEAGKDAVGKGGVVRDKAMHAKVLRDTLGVAADCDLRIVGLTHSPIKGPAGNIEFLAHWKNFGDASETIDVNSIVEAAHTELSKD